MGSHRICRVAPGLLRQVDLEVVVRWRLLGYVDLQGLRYLKRDLRRVQTALPSVKNQALGKDCRTRQRIALDKEFFKALGKGLLCREPDSR